MEATRFTALPVIGNWEAMRLRADILISMGCGVEESCPVIYLDKFMDWHIEDPYRQPIGDYRRARDAIEGNALKLILQLRKK